MTDALVTGASAGIGEAFARIIAARGADLLLSALPQERDRLEALAGELRRRHGVRCAVEPVDLTDREGPARLRDAAERLGFRTDLLVNNAGVRWAGAFSAAPPDASPGIVHVNVEAVVALTRLFLDEMVERRAGAVVNVASTAAFGPQPYLALYGASKAFVLSLGQALWAECREDGVRVVTICAGPVATAPGPGQGSPEAKGVWRFVGRRLLTADAVAEAALDAVARDRPVVVMRMRGIGPLHRVLSLARIVLPVRRRLRLAARANRWAYGVDGEGA